VLGIYDEYNWLSGTPAGGPSPGRDELRERHLFWSTSAVPGPEPAVGPVVRRRGLRGRRHRATDVEYLLEPGLNWVFDGGDVHWADWEIVAALAHPAGEITDEAAVTDVTARARFVSRDRPARGWRCPGPGCRRPPPR